MIDSPVHRVVAIDGPAASGKSSVARALARNLGYAYINSGAMYRAVTWHILHRGIDPSATDAIAQETEAATISSDLQDGESRIRINGIDPGAHLRDAEVNAAVSAVSSVPRVREILVAQMRKYARVGDLVMEGRDIATAVFPETPFKFYIDASPEVRQLRRAAEGQNDQVTARDRADSSRRASPLAIARDAHVIDSSQMTIAEVVQQMVARIAALDPAAPRP